MLDALWIVLLGMAIIFTVLGVLLGIMVILSRLSDRGNGEKAR